MKEQPQFTVVTRCYKRPQALTRCIESVQAQTCHDWEQIFIVDRVGMGLKWANQQFDACHHRVAGRYVVMLDDDGFLVDPTFLASVAQMIQRCAPGAILVKSLDPMYVSDIQQMLLPPPEVWDLAWERGVRPSDWIGNGYNFITRANLWKARTHCYWEGMGEEWFYGGDWHYANSLCAADTLIVRVDSVGGGADYRGYGKTTEDVGDGWFEQVAAQFHLVHLGDDDWRLRTWLDDRYPPPARVQPYRVQGFEGRIPWRVEGTRVG